MKLNFKTIPKYCISLKRSEERRVLVQRQFKRAGIEFEFFDAVDRNDLILPELSDKDNVPRTFKQGTGIMACMLSHLKLMKRARKQGLDAIVVFEDDIVVSDDFNDRMMYMERLEGFDFDILSLGGHFPGVTTMAGAAHGTDWNHIYQIISLNGTYGYIITAKAMDFCIRNLHYGFGIDQFFGDHLYRRFKSYAFVPFLVGARPCKSEIVGVHCDYDNTKHFYQQGEIKDLNVPYVSPLDTELDKARKESDKRRAELLKSERA